ncbi:ABC transporter ATP-binding protein [Paenibacillus ihuae]|uniref:ABC transporter ATP-binding protein n=1 Tax=Paenibacillus ihuae TaxID=1232431 RepID=UPI000A950F22|nr:ABC transporter ATP-binding protein [Paenibacillus ihuae]
MILMKKFEASGNEVIRVNDVTKQYDNGTLALRNVRLTIDKREFVSLVGPSGCGKSTLLRIMAGLDRPTTGTVEAMGSETKGIDNASFVFQDANLMPWRTILANVELPLEMQGTSKRECREKAQNALSKVGLSAYFGHYPRQLSGGMKMRVSIARALVSEPKVLYMDEPFGALDEMTRQRLHQELLDIWMNSDLTIVFVTHNVFEAVYLSDRVVVMEAHPGRIKQIIPIDEPFPRNKDFLSSNSFGERVRSITDAL